MSDDFYHDDPVEEIPKKSLRSKFLSTGVVIVSSVFFFQSTLAGNISLNSDARIEFGQGIVQTTTCAGNPVNLTITAGSTFANQVSGGTHYLKTIRVDNVPSACRGVDFSLSTFTDSGARPNVLFDSATLEPNAAVIYMSPSSVFYPVNSGNITVTTNSSSSFTLSLDTPSANSNDVAKVTIQSAAHNPSAGITWKTASNIPANSVWNGITYGEGKYVAVGSNTGGSVGQAMYSTDGISWTLSTNVPNQVWNNVTYGNGKFVAIQGNYTMSSNDGINWTAGSTSLIGQLLYGLAYGAGKFVAQYYNGFVYSSDGSTWTKVVFAKHGSRIIFANNNFLSLSGSGDSATVSSDGVNWTTTGDSLLKSTTIGGFTYGNGTFVGTTTAGIPKAIYSTNNGQTWTTVSVPTQPYIGMAYGNGLFVAVGYNSTSGVPQGIYSTDGITWTTASNLPTGRWTWLVYGDSKFVAVATTGEVMYSG